MTYRHLTNLETSVDDVDGNFLNTLKDYKLGPPLPTEERDQLQLILLGIVGVYSTVERLQDKEVKGLTGFDINSLSPIILGERYKQYKDLIIAYGDQN